MTSGHISSELRSCFRRRPSGCKARPQRPVALAVDAGCRHLVETGISERPQEHEGHHGQHDEQQRGLTAVRVGQDQRGAAQQDAEAVEHQHRLPVA